MAEIPDIPDIEAALIDVLSENTAIVTAGFGERVSTELPDDFTAEQRIQLFRTTSAPVDGGTQVAHRQIVQVNSFGEDKDEANVAANLANKAIRALEFTKVGDISIGAVDLITGPQWSPDPSTDIPRNISTYGIVTRKRID